MIRVAASLLSLALVAVPAGHAVAQAYPVTRL